jgi:hypothetical protein
MTAGSDGVHGSTGAVELEADGGVGDWLVVGGDEPDGGEEEELPLLAGTLGSLCDGAVDESDVCPGATCRGTTGVTTAADRVGCTVKFGWPAEKFAQPTSTAALLTASALSAHRRVRSVRPAPAFCAALIDSHGTGRS